MHGVFHSPQPEHTAADTGRMFDSIPPAASHSGTAAGTLFRPAPQINAHLLSARGPAAFSLTTKHGVCTMSAINSVIATPDELATYDREAAKQ